MVSQMVRGVLVGMKMLTMNKDNYDEAIDKLYGLTVMLYGGYYEPKSDRDKELADDLHKIWMKHYADKNDKRAGIFDPKNAHLFTVEAGLKAFAYIELDKVNGLHITTR